MSPQIGRFHEGGQDQVDEATLVAGPTPLAEAVGRVLVEGPVAAPEDAVEFLELGELLRHPELASAAQVGEDRELRLQVSSPTKWAKPSSNSAPLDHW